MRLPANAPARFYLDEDVPRAFTVELLNSGYDAVHVRDLGAKGRGDDYQLFAATDSERIMIIYNRKDYLLLHQALNRWIGRSASSTQPIHGGILCFPQGLTPYEFRHAVSVFLSTAWPIEGRFYVYEPAHGWVEQPYAP